MNRHTHHAMAYYEFEALASCKIAHGIFTRLGGVSEGMYSSLNLSRSTGDAAETVQENRARVNNVFGLKHEETLTSWLVHGNKVRVVNWDNIGQNDEHADAMVTQTPGLALCLRFADCVPVILHDPVQRAVAIAHAGWPGIVCNVLQATVQAMVAACHSNPRNLIAGVGPSIGPTKFEVGWDVADKIQASVSQPVTLPHPDESKCYVNLWQSAYAQLRDCEVEHIECAEICTASNTHEWFSHRAERGKTGRFGALAMLC